jgi:hypothetical protein
MRIKANQHLIIENKSQQIKPTKPACFQPIKLNNIKHVAGN